MEITNQQGESGGICLGIEAWNPPTGAIAKGFTVINDATISAITWNYTGTAEFINKSIPAGAYVAGLITGITVSVGLIQLHSAQNGQAL